MANILLPTRFKDKLDKNQELDGIVKIALSSFGDILEENKLYFFSEYTNHGIKHIQDVLFSSDNLITDETYLYVLTDKDIGYYILSVILHDIGMHIDLEGFKSLINGDFDDVQVEEFDNLTWKELWEDFLSEARKFSGEQLNDIFGDQNTVIRMPPFFTPGDINENDKKLIGEFIRRFHARLAHEIAIKGFPSKKGALEFANQLDQQKRNIIGLIARSHGTSLRSCIDYIETIYGRESRRFPNGIHATYLMILLRIADYIQIDSSRTSHTLLKIKTFSSPVSAQEHLTHLAVDNINYRWHDDPERIYVNASPQDSKMFLKLQKLIRDIQYEFDMSWAVLGELYGKNSDNDCARIKYRRISSNIDDREFIKRQTYIPDKFAFKANDEIIRLLVAPLYGNDPKYGVRELLQNALDACRERENYEEKRGNFYKALIKVEIEEIDNISYFKITDNGMGMDSEVIKNYFLTAGSSYRRSLNWQKEFINTQGKSVVKRSGRFGVGILAAFLIGDQLHVETKKVNTKTGYSFEANLNSQNINIVKKTSINEGTTIRIKINRGHYFRDFTLNTRDISWHQWYTLSVPEVKYFIDKVEMPSYLNFNPDNTNELPIHWSAIESDGYNKILWSYSEKFANIDYSCNGIVIPNSKPYRNSWLNFGLLSSTAPQVSIFDNNANLPLTLDRNSFSEKLSFNEELLIDLYKDFIAYFLVCNEFSYVDKNKVFFRKNTVSHPGTRKEYAYSYSQYHEALYGTDRYLPYSEQGGALNNIFNIILISKKGFILNYNFFIQKLKSVNMILMQLNHMPAGGLKLDLKEWFILLTDNKLSSIDDYKGAIQGLSSSPDSNYYQPINSRIYLKTEKYNYLFHQPKKRMPTWLKDQAIVQFDKLGITCLHLNNPVSGLISESFLKENHTNIHFIRESQVTCPYEGDVLLDTLLEKYIGSDVVIPFSVKAREEKFPLAFKELKRYMEKYIMEDTDDYVVRDFNLEAR